MSNADWLDDGTLMWPHITSPLARRVLAAVFYKISEPMTGSPENPRVIIDYKGEIELRSNLRERLRNSGLAQAIAAGPDSMPSRFDYLPHWQQLISKHNAPKTLEQLAVHVMFNLDWYLDSPKPASLFAPMPWTTGLSLFVVISALAVSNTEYSWLSFWLLLIAIAILLIPLLAASKRDEDSVMQSEFFFYLLECYGEGTRDD